MQALAAALGLAAGTCTVEGVSPAGTVTPVIRPAIVFTIAREPITYITARDPITFREA
jgi:hypothetical protein